MMGSLFSSISGLRNHSTWMNTIGNNISNVNTVGYKAQRVTFKEQITQMMGAASGANLASNIGGKNPIQLGLGSALGSIDSIMTQGAIQTTGNPLDIAITGEGFFTVKNGAQTLYTRAGNFYQDNIGNIITSSGGIVQGWMGTFTRTIGTINNPSWHGNPIEQIVDANYRIDTSDVSRISNIIIPKDLRMAAQSTTVVSFAGNLDSGTPQNQATQTPGVLPANDVATPMAATAGIDIATVNASTTYFVGVTPDLSTTMTVYDSLGNPRNITLWFFQRATQTPGAGMPDERPYWDWYAFDTTYVQGSAIYTGSPTAANCIAGSQISVPNYGVDRTGATRLVYSGIWFNNDGSLASNGAEWDPAGGLQGVFNDPISGQTYYGPHIFILPDPTNTAGLNTDGALQMWFCLNFGRPNTWSGVGPGIPIQVNSPTNTPILAAGLRDGLTGDVAGNYQMVGGTLVYQPYNNVYAREVSGWRSGDLIGLSVDSTGGIVGQFTNDKSITLAKLAIAMFLNPQGLERVGDSMYALSSNSGLPRYVTAGAAGAGTTTGGALESSNVDLSVELTNMIIAQRGFEANARIVTTSADMLDTLVNLGR